MEGFNSMMSVLENAVGTFNGHLWSFLPILLGTCILKRRGGDRESVWWGS